MHEMSVIIFLTRAVLYTYKNVFMSYTTFISFTVSQSCIEGKPSPTFSEIQALRSNSICEEMDGFDGQHRHWSNHKPNPT